jgi:hypothetical protein
MNGKQAAIVFTVLTIVFALYGEWQRQSSPTAAVPPPEIGKAVR